MKTLTYSIHTALRQMLDESDIRQEQLAVAADISKGSVTNYIKGRQLPKWSTVRLWAEACGFDPEDPTLRELWDEARQRRAGSDEFVWLYGFPPDRQQQFDFLPDRDEAGRWQS